MLKIGPVRTVARLDQMFKIKQTSNLNMEAQAYEQWRKTNTGFWMIDTINMGKKNLSMAFENRPHF